MTSKPERFLVMANLVGKFIVSDKYVSDKTGRAYLSLVDTSNGGQVKLSFDTDQNVKGGDVVNFDGEVKFRLYNGNVDIQVVKVNSTKGA
jgi:hypothetical protein